MSTTYQITKDGYGIWMEALPSINNAVALSFKSQWVGAKDPNELQNKFQMILTKSEIDRLIEVLIEQGNKLNGC